MKLLKKLTKALTLKKAKPAVKKAAVKQVKKPAAKPAKKPVKNSAAKKPQKKPAAKPAKKPIKKASKPATKKPVAKAAAKSVPSRTGKKSLQKTADFAQSLKLPEPEKKAIRQYPVLPGGQSARVAMLVPLLRELVKKGTISDWLINLDHQRNANLYVERNFTIEDELFSIKEDVLLTVYERFNDGTIGEAQIPIITIDPIDARQQILTAKETCAHARKKAFDLPQPSDDIVLPQSYDERMLSALFAGNGFGLCMDVYERAKATMASIADVKTSAFEILTSAGTARVINSNGVDISFHKTGLYLEIVLSCKGLTGESEFVLTRIAASPEQLDIQSLLLQQVQIVRDATTAKQCHGFEGDVLLAGQSVTEVFAPHMELNPLVLHTSAKLDSMGLSCLHMNQPVGHFIGELPTIITNPSLPLGLGTAPVDEEGTPLKPVELLRNGVFVSHIATARYAQYLGVPVTGNLSNIQLQAGATREQHLRGNNYYEIVSFSWFFPNAMSGDFSAEIRLGYHWMNGRRTAFKGGMFTGNIFKNILNVRFSKETMLSGNYYGPRAVLFKSGQIVKTE